MLWLSFGARRPAPTDRRPDREVGEWAVHLECPWRISAPGGVIAGRSDIYVPADPDVSEEAFEWDRERNSIVDHQLRRWLDSANPLRVLDIAVDRCAGFTLHFPNEVSLE